MTNIVVLFFTYSVIGLFYEAFTILFCERKFDLNRGFLIGPYIPIYGFGSMFILEIGKYSDNLYIIFLLSFISCMIIEYFTSYMMEMLFNARWWDYSNYKFNLNGRVELGRLISFGVMGVIIIKLINPVIVYLLSFLSLSILNSLSYFIVIIMLIDFIVSSYVSYCYSKNMGDNLDIDRTTYFKKEVSKKISSIIK